MEKWITVKYYIDRIEVYDNSGNSEVYYDEGEDGIQLFINKYLKADDTFIITREYRTE